MEDEAKTKRNEILAKAREKAAELRKKRAEEKAQAADIQKQIKEQLETPTPPIQIPPRKKKEQEECQFKHLENVKEISQEELANPSFIQEKKKKKKKKQIIVLQNSTDSDSDSSTEQIIIRQKSKKNKEKKLKEEEEKKAIPVDQPPKLDEVENELLKRQYKEQLDKMRFDALKNFLVPQSNWRR